MTDLQLAYAQVRTNGRRHFQAVREIALRFDLDPRSVHVALGRADEQDRRDGIQRMTSGRRGVQNCKPTNTDPAVKHSSSRRSEVKVTVTVA